MKKIWFLVLLLYLSFGFSCSKKQVEDRIPSGDSYSDERVGALGRGVVSYYRGPNETLLSWRLLPEDPEGVSFHIYRKEVGAGNGTEKLISRTDRTAYLDRTGQGSRYTYFVRAVHAGKERMESGEAIALDRVAGNAALIFDLGKSYKQARVATGDLNGDGEPEVVVAYSDYPNVDPYEKARSRSGDSVKVAAFTAPGRRMWTLDLGKGIEAGLNYQPMVISDLDGDGRAEVILKTNRTGDPLDYHGDRITILDGVSGKARMEAEWPSLEDLGSDYNNDSRNYLAVAHLDGRDPYIIVVRGLYKAQRMWAYDRNLHRVWERTLGLDHHYPSGLWERLTKFWNIDDKVKYLRDRLQGKTVPDLHRGSHSLPVADIDGDGKEEILWGERCIGENGRDLWTIERNTPYRGHPDIVFPANIIPLRNGKQIFYGREGWGERKEKIGVYLVDHRGKVLWEKWGFNHIDRGWAGKIVPGLEGMQCLGIDILEKEWSKEGAELIEPAGYLWDSEGKLLWTPPPSWYYSFPVDWDGDGTREVCIMEEGVVQKYGGASAGRLTAECIWGADLFGDHREEIVAAPGDGKIYIFFNTDTRAIAPRITPMSDRQYRNDLTRTAMHGFVIPTEGGFIPGKPKR